MLNIFNVVDTCPALHEVHTALAAERVSDAQKLLLGYLSHQTTYERLQAAFGACAGILKYVHTISFSANVPTACCNILTGDIQLGIDFFKEHVQSPTDLLFLLLHERNHYLIKKMQFAQISGLSTEYWNLFEDAYINGPLYKALKPPFILKYYEEETGLQSILYPLTEKFDNWLKEIEYTPKHRQQLVSSHKLLYGYTDSNYMHASLTEYARWMKNCRKLLDWLKEQHIQHEPSPDSKSKEAFGSMGHGEEHKAQPKEVDIDQSVKQAEDLGKRLSTYKWKGDNLPWGDNMSIGRVLTIVVPKITLDGVDGRLLKETWDSSLSTSLSVHQHMFEDMVFKVNQAASLLGSASSSPAMQNVGIQGKSMYPYQIGRQDITMLGAGQVPTSWSFNIGQKMEQLPLYVDVSGSMLQWYVLLPWLTQHMKHQVGKVYHFSGTNAVFERPKDTQILWVKGGTNFNSVATHILENKYQRALILTDNEGRLKPKLQKEVKRKGIGIYLLDTSFPPLKGSKESALSYGWNSVASRTVHLQRYGIQPTDL